MSLIKFYKIEEKGFNYLLLCDSWQIAKLNYSDDQKINELYKLKKHVNISRGYIILRGHAIIISAQTSMNDLIFEVELMKTGVSYFIPKNTWYAIAMQTECEILLVENPNRHLKDVEYFMLSKEQIKNIGRRLHKKLELL